jgi:hypothetical protein
MDVEEDYFFCLFMYILYDLTMKKIILLGGCYLFVFLFADLVCCQQNNWLPSAQLSFSI